MWFYQFRFYHPDVPAPNARLVVDAATAHINRFDLGCGHGFDRVKISFANLEVIFDGVAETATETNGTLRLSRLGRLAHQTQAVCLLWTGLTGKGQQAKAYRLCRVGQKHCLPAGHMIAILRS